MNQRQEDIRDALRRMYHLDFTFLETVKVRGLLGLEIEVFAIHGHKEAVKVYAWSYEQEGETKYHSVLHLPPLTCPTRAVWAVVLAEIRSLDA